MRLALALLTATVGCGFDSSATNVDSPFLDANLGQIEDASIRDAFVADAVPDADPSCMPDTALGFTPTNIDACQLPPAKTGKTMLDQAGALDTAALMEAYALVLPQTGGGPDVLVLHFEDLQIGNLLLVGETPVVMVADTISITGDFQVRAENRTGDSPGADVECGSGLGTNGDSDSNSNGYRGGSGGGYGGAGGDGGDAKGTTRVAGGTANGTDSISPLRGGCSGGRGGRPALSFFRDGASGGGAGGGAIQLVARTSITVSGTLSAPGHGGGTYYTPSCGTNQAGGSGGGSGGSIFLESPSISVTGNISALGGAGGEGRDRGGGSLCNLGRGNTRASAAGQSAFPLTGQGSPDPAVGGSTSNQDGGNGGDGSAKDASSPGLVGGDGRSIGGGNDSGGGGGGGGTGRIRLRAVGGSPVIGGNVIPPARTN